MQCVKSSLCLLGAAGGAASFGLSACHPSNAGDGKAGSCKSNVGSFCTGWSKAKEDLTADDATTTGLGDYLNIPNLQVAMGTAGTISGNDREDFKNISSRLINGLVQRFRPKLSFLYIIRENIYNSFHRICGAVFRGDNNDVAPQMTVCSFDTPFRVGVHFDSDDIVGRKDGLDAFNHLENQVQADGLAGTGYTGFQLDYWQNTC